MTKNVTLFFLLSRSLFLVLASTMSGNAKHTANAEDLLVFISAFAAGDEGAIHACRLDTDTGQLEPMHRTTDVEHPFFLAISPDQRSLYSIHAPTFGGKEPEQIAAYEIEGRTGRLKLLNRQSTLGMASCYLDVDATGKVVLVANYATGSVASLPIRSDGSLDKATSFLQHTGSSVNPARQKEPHAHSIVISPDNRYAYAADLGIDQILGYRLDPTTAKLAPNRQPNVRTSPGAGPRHLTFHPNGQYLYVIHELENAVTRFDWIAKSGMLIEKETISTLPADWSGTSHCADLKITPNGRFLYGTNRGHDSIAAYAIGNNGHLTRIGIEPSLGAGPQNLAITPDGKLLLCANMPGNNVALFTIDPATGRLKPAGKSLAMPKPSCIMLLP